MYFLHILFGSPAVVAMATTIPPSRDLKAKENHIAIILTDIAIIVNCDMFTIFAQTEIIIMRI